MLAEYEDWPVRWVSHDLAKNLVGMCHWMLSWLPVISCQYGPDWQALQAVTVSVTFGIDSVCCCMCLHKAGLNRC